MLQAGYKRRGHIWMRQEEKMWYLLLISRSDWCKCKENTHSSPSHDLMLVFNYLMFIFDHQITLLLCSYACNDIWWQQFKHQTGIFYR